MFLSSDQIFFLKLFGGFWCQIKFSPQKSFDPPVFLFNDIKNGIDIGFFYLIERFEICKFSAVFRPVRTVKPSHVFQFFFQAWIRPHVISSYCFLRYSQSKEQKCCSDSCPVFSCGTVKNNGSILYMKQYIQKASVLFQGIFICNKATVSLPYIPFSISVAGHHTFKKAVSAAFFITDRNMIILYSCHNIIRFFLYFRRRPEIDHCFDIIFF